MSDLDNHANDTPEESLAKWRAEGKRCEDEELARIEASFDPMNAKQKQEEAERQAKEGVAQIAREIEEGKAAEAQLKADEPPGLDLWDAGGKFKAPPEKPRAQIPRTKTPGVEDEKWAQITRALHVLSLLAPDARPAKAEEYAKELGESAPSLLGKLAFYIKGKNVSGGQRGDSSAGAPKEFKYTAFEDIAFDTEEEWLVKKLLPLTGVAALYGPSGGYKSFLLFDLSLHVALGWPWAGRRVKQADVVYIAAEGAGGFKKRKVGWLKDREGVPNKVPFHLQTVAPNLGGAKHDLQTLIDSVEKAELKPGVICIDTLAQSLGGGDENSAGMAQFVSNATALAIHFKCLVIVVHHVGLSDDERLRGSTNLIGGLDASIHCARNEGTLSALLKVKKLKDEDVDQIFTVDMKLVEISKDSDGDPVTTLVVDSIWLGEGEQVVSTPEQNNLSVLLAIIKNPAAMPAELGRQCNVSRDVANRTISRLIESRLIKKNSVKPGYTVTKAGKEAAQSSMSMPDDIGSPAVSVKQKPASNSKPRKLKTEAEIEAMDGSAEWKDAYRKQQRETQK